MHSNSVKKERKKEKIPILFHYKTPPAGFLGKKEKKKSYVEDAA